MHKTIRAPKSTPAQTPQTRPQPSVLLVDDQPARLLACEAVLAGVGVSCIRALSGEEALRQLLKQEFAVIVLDVSMPGMDGFETARLIRQHPRMERTPIIFVTGVHISELDRLTGYEVGAIDYISLPIVPEILRSKVALLVELYHRRAELSSLNRELEAARAQLEAKHRKALADQSDLLSAHSFVREELVELRRNLLHAGRITALGELASGLAHELRQPLTAIMTDAQAAQMLLRAPESNSADLPEILSEIMRDAQRAAGVIDRLGKMLSRQPLALARMSVEDLLKDVTSLVHGDIVKRKVSLQTNLGYSSTFILGDRVHLSQVLINLIINAMDALDGIEGARRRIVLQARTHRDGWIAIGVSDAGPGVPAEAMKTIFEPFFTTKPSGMGMGLSISRTIIEAHKGRLWVENNPEVGATFWFSVPTVSEQN